MRATLIILACAAMGVPPQVVYGGPPGQSGALGYVEPGHSHGGGAAAGEEQIIESVQKRYNAKVVRVTAATVDGRAALRLRLLSAQRVWSVVVDAHSGRLLSGG